MAADDDRTAGTDVTLRDLRAVIGTLRSGA
jgi:hypothetical protein